MKYEEIKSGYSVIYSNSYIKYNYFKYGIGQNLFFVWYIISLEYLPIDLSKICNTKIWNNKINDISSYFIYIK